MLRVAPRLLPEPTRDLTFVFYEAEEIDSRVQRPPPRAAAAPGPDRRRRLRGPPRADRRRLVEGGCKGTLRAEITTKGIASHSARPWKGHNAIHDAGEILGRLAAYQPRTRPSSTASTTARPSTPSSSRAASRPMSSRTGASSRSTTATPLDLSPERGRGACAHRLRRLRRAIVDNAGGALPGLHLPAAQAFVAALGVEVTAKQGWTDVARFSAMGVPAVNFGPGDPNLAHMDDEQCPGGAVARRRGGHDAVADQGGRVRAPRGAGSGFGAESTERDLSQGSGHASERSGSGETTDQRLLDRHGRTDWVHTDPWRVLAHPERVRRGVRRARRGRAGGLRLRVRTHQA
jgi:hypothetical protein